MPCDLVLKKKFLNMVLVGPVNNTLPERWLNLLVFTLLVYPKKKKFSLNRKKESSFPLHLRTPPCKSQTVAKCSSFHFVSLSKKKKNSLNRKKESSFPLHLRTPPCNSVWNISKWSTHDYFACVIFPAYLHLLYNWLFSPPLSLVDKISSGLEESPSTHWNSINYPYIL